jgi:cysteine desulfurase
MTGICLDHNASTPIDPNVADAVRSLLDVAFGKPSSEHWADRPPKAALEKARAEVARLPGGSPEEIVFTSGGSEANNLALKGSFFAECKRGNHIITRLTEHPAIPRPLAFLERPGAEVTYLPLMTPAAIRTAFRLVRADPARRIPAHRR